MKFKRFTLLTLSICLAGISVFVLSSQKEARYFPKSTENPISTSAQGYLDYIQSIKANQLTGDISPEDVWNAQKQASKLSKGKASIGINWGFKGPDNVGGRTRAFIIDKNDSDHLLAGGVAGGVFESFDAGQTWNVYDPDYKVKNISCITQGADGSFYVGTGGHFEGGASGGRGYFFIGSGVHKLTGNGNFQTIVAPSNRLSSATAWATVGQIYADPNNANILYAAMNLGFRRIDMSGAEPVITDPIGFNRFANDVAVSNDGKIIVAYQGGEIYTSHDGVNFIKNSFSGVGRTAIAFAPSNSNIAYLSMAKSNSCLYGVFRSSNGGISWKRISPEGTNSFDMMANPGVNCQGGWDNAIAVYPNDPGRVIVAGVTTYRWEQSSVDPAPPNGSWNQIDVLFEQQANGTRVPFYIHADKHRIVFDPNNDDIAYIANDGGIYKTTNFTSTNPTYNKFNFNYRVTQYYNIAVGPNDVAIGGAQDNGTQLVGLKFNNNLGGVDVQGGDGFDCELSTVNPSIGFASSQFGTIRRIQGIGTTTTNSNLSSANITNNNTHLGAQCGSPAGCSEVFYTVSALWESFDHVGSRDSVDQQITEKTLPPMPAGRTFEFTSVNSSSAREIKETYTLPAPLNPDDTLIVGDPNILTSTDLTETGSTTVITNYDTLIVDTTNSTVTIRRPNGNTSTLAYVLNTPVKYYSQYLTPQAGWDSITFEVDTSNVNGRRHYRLTYVDAQIDFYYALKFQDRVSTIYATANWPGSGGSRNERNVYITRDAMKNSPQINWYSVAGSRSTPDAIPNNTSTLCMEFSADGDHLFLGLSNGEVYRISNINSVSSSLNPSTSGSWYDIQQNVLAGQCRRIGNFQNRAVTDIAIDPNNPDNLVVSLGNYGNSFFVARTNIATTATSPTGTFTSIQGIGANQLPKAPAYTVLFDKNNTNTLLVGTEIGVFATENVFETAVASDTVVTPADTVTRTQDTVSNPGASTVLDTLIKPADSLVIPNDTVIYFPADTQYVIQLNPPVITITPGRTDITVGADVKWTEETIGMGRVPVFALEQMKFDYTKAINDGKIYAGTHGRGIYESDKFVGIPEVEHNVYKPSFKSSLQFYPNPARNNAKIEFNLAEAGAVQIQIFDIRGQLMREDKINGLTEGLNQVNLNFDEFNNGTYIIRVYNGREFATQKFILFK